AGPRAPRSLPSATGPATGYPMDVSVSGADDAGELGPSRRRSADDRAQPRAVGTASAAAPARVGVQRHRARLIGRPSPGPGNATELGVEAGPQGFSHSTKTRKEVCFL